MTNIVAIDRERHAGKGWRHPQGYGFAAASALTPIGGSEFSHALHSMPIGFIEGSGHYLPVALTAVTRGKNLFVGPNGQWLGGYTPAVLRTYPFSLVRPKGSEQPVLCIDEDSGLIADESEENVERFFEPGGTLAPATKTIADFLRFIEQDQTITDLAVMALAEAGLIKPWSLTVPIGDQQVAVNGLYRVDEPGLKELDDAAFLKLRKSSALVIAYGQLFSMAQVSSLTRLSLIQQQLEQPHQPLNLS
jgi:hypothetical protein